MSQITGPITINNGAATPVAKTFSPERVSPELSVFTERSAGASSGFIRLSYGLDVAKSTRKTNRVNVEISMPVTAIVNGITSLQYTGLFKGYWVLPDQMSPAERADMHAFVTNALANANIKAAVKDLDPAY